MLLLYTILILFYIYDIHITPRISTGVNMKPWILIVDDEPTLLRLFARTISCRWLGIDIVTATNGREAMARLKGRTTQPELILSDIDMPEMTGLELVEHLCGEGSDFTAPIILMSGDPGRDAITRLVDQGIVKTVVGRPIQPITRIVAILADFLDG